jgi:DoxX-like family
VFIALVIATVLVAAMAAGSAAKKLQKDQQVLTVIGGTVGVPERYFPVLAAVEIAGAVGIIIGLWLEPLGIAAAAGLVAYFVGAAIGHLRAGDTKGLSMPAVPLFLSIIVLALRLLSA